MNLSYQPVPKPDIRWNLRQLYWDVFWFGILAGSTLAFLSVYAARLGASSLEVGLLSAGPAIVNLVFTLPAGRWLEGKPLIRAAFVSSIGQRAGYIVLVFLPWLFIQIGQVWAIIGLTLVMSVAGTLLAIAFNAMFAEVVPVEWRGKAVAWRNVLVAVSVMCTTLLSGYILDKIIFPANYQIVFLIGAVGALMSSFHLGRVRLPGETNGLDDNQSKSLPDNVRKAYWSDWLRLNGKRRKMAQTNGKPLLRLDILGGPFGLFMAGYLAFYAFQYFSLPLFPLYYVNVLHLTDGAISLGSAMFHGTMILGSLLLNRVSIRFGHRKVMLFGVFLFGQFPLLLGLAQDARLYYAACLISGVVFAFLNGGLINRLMERVPADDRPAHMALHNLSLNLGILAGSLLGPVIGDWLGLREALFIGTGLRLLAAVLLWWWG
jgi:MFS family permease